MIDPPVLTSGVNLGKSTFACTLQWCIHICHKTSCPFAESHVKMFIYCIFYCKCTFEMAVMCLILQDTPWKISMQKLHFWDQHQKLEDDWPPWFWHLVAILEILLLHALSNDACKICHKTCCPLAESHLKMIIYYIFYCKCTFEMAVICLILQETSWKISMQNLHFWDQHQKLKDDWPLPPIWPGSHLKFLSSDLACTWWKMIDSLIWPGSHLNFFSSHLACTWWKMIDCPPSDHDLT